MATSSRRRRRRLEIYEAPFAARALQGMQGVDAREAEYQRLRSQEATAATLFMTSLAAELTRNASFQAAWVNALELLRPGPIRDRALAHPYRAELWAELS